MRNFATRFTITILFGSLISSPCFSGEARSPSLSDWEKTVEAAKKEGKLVAAIPASAELRKAITEVFPKRFPGIELDLTNARGPANAGKIAAEFAAGVRYFDLLISGTSTPFSLLNAGILEPAEPLMILPEVKDPKRWFGGHIWLDNAKKFIYAFQVYQSENIWHNTTLIKLEEARSYDDLLNPKFKGKIGILDPRSAGAGTATWAFFLKIKGEEWLRKLAAQEMIFIARPAPARRQPGQGQSRHHHRPDLLYVPAFFKGRPANQVVARYERRHLYELRQQRDLDRQELAASERDQSFHQLAVQQRRPRALRQGDGPSDAPPRCRHQMDG